MKLNPPAGHKLYGGTSPYVYPSADGAHYIAQCSRGPRGFGWYLFRQVGDAQATEVDYGELLSGRGSLMLGGDGILYITAVDDKSNVYWYVVPGYVRYTAEGPVPVPIPVVASAVDQAARNAAADAKKAAADAEAHAQRAESRIAFHEGKDHTPGISAKDASDLAWKLANDAIREAAKNPSASAFAEPAFTAYVKLLSQNVLVAAIEYAKTATAVQSRLRALIELVVKGAK